MSNPLSGLLPDDPRKIAKVKVHHSSEFRARGKGAWKFQLSDTELRNSEVLAAAAAPASYVLTCPTPENQAGEGACVAFAVAFAMRSIEQYYKSGASSYSKSVNVFSPAYMYNQINFLPGDCSSGSTILRAMDLLIAQGCCLWNTMPYLDVPPDYVVNCAVQPNNTQRTEAALYRITSYVRVDPRDQTAMKTALNQNHPLSFSLNVDQSFYNIHDATVWSAYLVPSTGYAAHETAVVGYDDTKHAYKCINSWGTGWGDGGFFWIDYDFFATISGWCYYMSNNVVPPPLQYPIANAGFNTTLPLGTPAALDGTASYDPDGTIVAYLWTQLSGPNSATIANSTVATASASNLIAGVYKFDLRVTDNDSQASHAQVTITVNAASPEGVTLTGTSQQVKGKVNHALTWAISLNNPPQSAIIESFISPSTTYGTVYSIVPYTPQGTWNNLSTIKRKTYSYRVKVVKSTGDIVYSNVVTITN